MRHFTRGIRQAPTLLVKAGRSFDVALLEQFAGGINIAYMSMVGIQCESIGESIGDSHGIGRACIGMARVFDDFSPEGSSS
jgi:hypothetical protein